MHVHLLFFLLILPFINLLTFSVITLSYLLLLVLFLGSWSSMERILVFFIHNSHQLNHFIFYNCLAILLDTCYSSVVVQAFLHILLKMSYFYYPSLLRKVIDVHLRKKLVLGNFLRIVILVWFGFGDN